MDQQAITFSIVSPTRNRAHLLPRAIRSVLRQTCPDFELLLIDDASTDDTSDVVGSFSDPRIVYICSEVPRGAAGARNLGMRLARGEFIAFLDDDDEYLPDFLTQVARAFRDHPRPDVGFCWTGVQTVADTEHGEIVLDEHVWNPRFHSREEAFLEIMKARRIGTPHLTIRKSCLERVEGFDESLPAAEDTDFIIRLAKDYDFCVAAAPLVRYHQHPGERLSTSKERLAGAYERLTIKYMPVLREHRELWVAYHYKTGWLCLHAGRRRKATRHLLKSLSRNPVHLKSWGALLLLALPGRVGGRVHRHIAGFRGRRHRPAGLAPKLG